MVDLPVYWERFISVDVGEGVGGPPVEGCAGDCIGKTRATVRQFRIEPRGHREPAPAMQLCLSDGDAGHITGALLSDSNATF